MDCYTKQMYPDIPSGAVVPGRASVMGLDMSMTPGTVIRPDMPLGSGPARGSGIRVEPMSMRCPERSSCSCGEKPAETKSMKCPERSSCSCGEKPAEIKPMKCPERPACSCGEKPAEVKPMKCPGMPTEIKPMKCPSMEKPAEIKPIKCPERPACPSAEKPAETGCMKCPDWSTGTSPAWCGNTPWMPAVTAPAENIDQFPIAMAYVPWQQWRQIYSMDAALGRGTIFQELDKPFIMGGCR